MCAGERLVKHQEIQSGLHYHIQSLSRSAVVQMCLKFGK